MKFLTTIFFLLSFQTIAQSQNISEQMKGSWVITKYQPAGIHGMTYQLAELRIGDTVTIDKNISQSLEVNEYTKAIGLSPIKCEFRVVKQEILKDQLKYFEEMFKLKPILLGLNEESHIYLINTNCKDNFYNEILFDTNSDRLFLIEEGMFFILKRIGEK